MSILNLSIDTYSMLASYLDYNSIFNLFLLNKHLCSVLIKIRFNELIPSQLNPKKYFYRSLFRVSFSSDNYRFNFDLVDKNYLKLILSSFMILSLENLHYEGELKVTSYKNTLSCNRRSNEEITKFISEYNLVTDIESVTHFKAEEHINNGGLIIDCGQIMKISNNYIFFYN